MARARMLSATLSTSRKFAALHEQAGALAEFAQALYCLVIPHADDHGRLDGDLWALKCRVYPSSPRDATAFAVALEALVAVGLLERAEVASRVVYRVTQAERHQHLRYPAQSALPWPGEPVRASDETRVQKRREVKRSTRTLARAAFPRRPGAAAEYLDGCQHVPRCEVARVCGYLRTLDEALAAGRVSALESQRLRQLWAVGADAPARKAR